MHRRKLSKLYFLSRSFASRFELHRILISVCNFILVGRPPFKYTSLSSTRKKIQNLSFDLPSALSQEAKDLINSIITYDYCRASALGISRSAFITKYAPQTLESLQFGKENLPPIPISSFSSNSKLPVQISKVPEQNMQRV